MKTLYVDNYKGFIRSFLPIKDVNFFVGENSTGKTSILNLLNLLSSPNFWFSLEFNKEDVELGYFDEISNKNQVGRKYFDIGIEMHEKKSKKSLQYMLLRFENKDEIPSITKFKVQVGNKSALIHMGKNIKYQEKESKIVEFQDWIDDLDYPTTMHKIHTPFSGNKVPFGFINGMIMSQIFEKNESKDRRDIGVSITRLFRNSNYISFAPIRAKAQRTYDSFKQNFSPDGEHIPFVLRSMLKSKKNLTLLEALRKFGKESSLFDEIKILELGKGKGSPFEIEVLYNKMPVRITNVGYGVSQILPVLIEILTSKGDVLSIQQPEVHLHPKAQAAFGEFIYNSFIQNRNQFVIETHSDFTINRFRYQLFKSQEGDKPQSQVVFFERIENGTKLSCLQISDKGKYPEEIPDAFGDFFIDEELKMLEL